MDTVIKVDNLRKAYGSVKAVDDISFSVAQGEVFGMLGPNGAGKTTTMEIVEGIRPYDSGSVSVLGMNIKRNQRKIKSQIGVQLQTTSMYPKLTVQEMLQLFGSFFPRHLSSDNLIKVTGLEESRKKRFENLSGGQKQRLSIALALVNNPKILFLDEPTSGLDPQSRHNIWSLVERVRAKGKTVFITTHYMDEAEHLCDRVAVIDHGKIIAVDKPDKLISQYFQEQAIEFDIGQRIDEGEFRRLAAVTNVLLEERKVTVYSSAIPVTISALMDMAKQKGVELTNLYVRRATLEDVFLKLTGRRIRD
jgi:ABC-2 type transport system ATP-binding protein